MSEWRKTSFKVKKADGKTRFLLFAFLIFCYVFVAVACSVPILEERECTESRQALKEFYSVHFDGDMRFSAENLQTRKRFLTAQFADSLRDAPLGIDVFTVKSDDFPKAFRIGACRVAAPDRTIFEVLVFWKTDTRNEQRAIEVETVRQNDKWLINKIAN